jgi:hypothetical protein
MVQRAEIMMPDEVVVTVQFEVSFEYGRPRNQRQGQARHRGDPPAGCIVDVELGTDVVQRGLYIVNRVTTTSVGCLPIAPVVLGASFSLPLLQV